MSTTQSSDTYEDLEPKKETEDTQESHLLRVHVPDGFESRDIGAEIEEDFGRVRVFGERSTGNNKTSRFNVKHLVPSYCDIGNIQGRFDGKIITITMPIIPGAKVPPKQEQEAPQPEPVVQETQPKEQGNDKEEDDSNAAAEVKDQKGNQDPKSTAESKEDAAHMASTPQEEQKVSVPQKGQQEAQVSKVESKGEAGHETSKPPEATEDSMPPKGEEKDTVTKDAKKKRVRKEKTKDHPKKPTVESGKLLEKESKEESSMPQKGQQEAQVSKVESKGEAGHETSKPPEATEDSMPPKGEEKDKDAKLQTKKKKRDRTEKNKDHSKETPEEPGKLSKEERIIAEVIREACFIL